MSEVGTPDNHYNALLMEVLAPEIILELIQEDDNLNREQALAILHHPLAAEYGRLVQDDEYQEVQVSSHEKVVGYKRKRCATLIGGKTRIQPCRQRRT